MTKIGWMMFKGCKPMNSINSIRLYQKLEDANGYLPKPARTASGITLEKVSVEITVLPTRGRK